jgi:integrase
MRRTDGCARLKPGRSWSGSWNLRFGEAAGVKVGDVDQTRRRLRIERSVSDVYGHLVVTTPKTHHTREVPVPAFVAAMLEDATHGRLADEPLFTGPGGGVLRGNNFRRRSLDRAAASVGLSGLTPHELRHTAASLAVSAGANVKAVQRMLGHASAAMTLDVYAGLFGDDLDEVADRLDATARAAADVRLTEAGHTWVLVFWRSPS